MNDDDGIDDEIPPGCVGCGCLLALPVVLAVAGFILLFLLMVVPLPG